jgi:hypothetical protein
MRRHRSVVVTAAVTLAASLVPAIVLVGAAPASAERVVLATTAPPTVVPTTSRPPIADYLCNVNWFVSSQGPTTFTALVTVSNPSSSLPLTPWGVSWAFQDGQVATGIADGVATFTQTGTRVTVTGAANLAPRTSITFALTATWNGVANQTPTGFGYRSSPGVDFPFGCQVTTTPPATSSSSPPNPIPPTPAPCVIDYKIVAQWPGGFTASVTLFNRTAEMNGWTVRWTFPNGQTIAYLWSGVNESTGSSAVVRNAAWNGNVPQSTTTSFGFNGTWSGTNPEPTAATLNGIACQVT